MGQPGIKGRQGVRVSVNSEIFLNINTELMDLNFFNNKYTWCFQKAKFIKLIVQNDLR